MRRRLTINALPVNLTGTRSYDGTTAGRGGNFVGANRVGSDNVTVASGSGTLAGGECRVGGDHVIWNPGVGRDSGGQLTAAGASGSVNIT